MIKLQSNTHSTYHSYKNQKDLQLNLDRALGGQPIKIGYSLKTTTESIGNSKGSTDRIGKEESYLYSFRKSADSVWKRNRQEQSLYMSRKD
jgi:hypothetical protein